MKCSKKCARRFVSLCIPAGRSVDQVFRTRAVCLGLVRAYNRSYGAVAVATSVSPDGVNYTILPGLVMIGPKRYKLLKLPAYATYTKLTITAPKRSAKVILSWYQYR